MNKRPLAILLLATVLATACGHSRQTERSRGMSVRDDGSAVTLLSAGKPVLTYNYAVTPAPEGVSDAYSRSGYIHPAWTPSGFVLTEIQPRDHYHHYGIWNPWTRVEYDGKVYDLWNLGDQQGTVRSRQVDAIYSKRKMCGFDATLDHIAFTPDGEIAIMEEQWRVRAKEVPEGFLWDFESHLTPSTDKTVTIKAYRYQGFSIRANSFWTKENCTMVTSEGLDRPQIDGSRARWILVDGETGPGSRGGFLFLSAKENYDAPEPLRIWNEEANNGRGDVFVNFCPAKMKDWALEPGHTYVLRYRVLTFDGTITPETAERLWEEYTDAK